METYDPRYVHGIAHFNQGDYFQAHEVWEDLWRAAPGPARLFYKGLIQAAVALYHAQRGNQRGAWKLCRRSNRVLAAYRPCYLGLDVDRFLAELEEGLRTRESCLAASAPPPSRPQINLPPRGW